MLPSVLQRVKLLNNASFMADPKAVRFSWVIAIRNMTVNTDALVLAITLLHVQEKP